MKFMKIKGQKGMNSNYILKKKKSEVSLNDVSNKVTGIIEKLISYKVFSELKDEILEMAAEYKAIDEIEALVNPAQPRVQQANSISDIPPEGIVIESPGIYTFSKTITWSPLESLGAAITIKSDDVVLDLCDYNLAAKIQDSSSDLVGISVSNVSNVAVINGSLTNMCFAGIHALHVSNLAIENILVSGIEYKNTNKRGATACGILVNHAVDVYLGNCEVAYMYVSADICAGIQVLQTIGAKIEACRVNNITNYAGLVSGFSYALSSGVVTLGCRANKLQSHFGANIRTGGHTVLGYFPFLCSELLYQDCTASNIIGSCDDCHGMSIFFGAAIQVKNYIATNVTDGVTQFNSGAKATGLEVYGAEIKVSDSEVDHIVAINPQNRVSTGFSVWGESIEFENCVASKVFVKNDVNDESLIMGLGTGFGWAPDPRLYRFAATAVKYVNCEAKDCQVAFDTWNHVDSNWVNPSYSNCAINILVEPGGTRTLYGDPMTECNPSVAVIVHNLFKANTFPGSEGEQGVATGASDTHDQSIHYAYPTGNINGLSVPSVFSRLDNVDTQWWFYVGLLTDKDNNNHSFELNFIEPKSKQERQSVMAVDLDFTFSAGGSDFHATSTFGGDGDLQVLQSIFNTIGVSTVSSANDQYRIDVTSANGPKVTVEYAASISEPQKSMFTGQLGQPGAAYTICAAGNTWLWKHSSGNSSQALYQYTVKMEMVDERGVVSEGLGSYVGIDPVNSPQGSRQSSVEYAQPRLRVKSWSVEFTRDKASFLVDVVESLEGFAKNYSFSGCGPQSGHIWLDRQGLFNAPATRSNSSRSSAVELLQGLQNTFSTTQIFDSLDKKQTNSDVIQHVKQAVSASTSASKQLYLGCWLPVILTSGVYDGATLLFVAFWDKAKLVADYDTQTDAHPNSFMNLYTGLSASGPNDTASAYTVSDFLQPDLVDSNGTAGEPAKQNYRIQFTEQFDHIGTMTDPQRWAKEIKVTVKAHTQARYALAAYAHRSGRTESSGVDSDITFTIKTLSPYTHATMISTKMGPPIYEGASCIFDSSGDEVGVGWVEQMIGDPQVST